MHEHQRPADLPRDLATLTVLQYLSELGSKSLMHSLAKASNYFKEVDMVQCSREQEIIQPHELDILFQNG